VSSARWPLFIFFCFLLCSIPNLDSQESAPLIDVTGTGIMPYCHFELENSDYLSRIRLSSENRPSSAMSLPPDTKVIEFKTFGIGVKHVKHFNVINPTDLKYTFSWTCTNVIQQRGPSPFSCITPKGTINGGMQAKVCLFLSSFIYLFTYLFFHLGILCGNCEYRITSSD